MNEKADRTPDWPRITREDFLGMVDVLKKKRLSISDGSGIIAEFEKRFAIWLGRRYALAQNSGTSTLHAAYFAISLKYGDEVIVPSYTWHSSVSPMLHLGAVPVFCDIEPDTLTIDPLQIRKLITRKTKAILVCHLFGIPARMDEIMQIASAHGLKVIEDCSHAYGTLYKGKKVGTFGDISCFSMQASKSLPAGEGGVFCTDNKGYFERALLLGHFGRLGDLKGDKRRYSSTGLGFKYRPHPLAISLALTQLGRLDDHISVANMNCELMEKLLSGIPGIRIFEKPEYCERRSYYGFRFGLDEQEAKLKKSEFIRKLRQEGIPADDERYVLLHEKELFLDRNLFSQLKARVKLPITENAHTGIINIHLPFAFDQKLVESYSSKIRDIIVNNIVIARLRQGLPAEDKSRHLQLELTMGCNMACRECYQRDFRKTHKDSRELDTGQVKVLIDRISPETVMLSGGEPASRKDFFKVLEILKKKDIPFLLLTNGKEFNSSFIMELEKAAGEGTINFSFDYCEEDSRASIDKSMQNGKGPMDRMKKLLGREMNDAMEKLKKRFRIVAGVVLYDDNLEDVKSLVENLRYTGIWINIIPEEFFSSKEIKDTKNRLLRVLKPEKGKSELICIEKNLSKEDIGKRESALESLKDYIAGMDHVTFLPEYVNKMPGDYYSEGGANHVKGICKNLVNPNIRVDSSGDVIVCRLIRHSMGSILNEPLPKTMQNERFMRFRKDYAKNGPYPVCRRCPHFISFSS